MGVVSRALTQFVPQEIKARRTGPNQGTTALASSPTSRREGKTSAQLYRNWAIHNPWIRTGFDIRSGQIQRAEWELYKFDREGPDPDKGLKRRMRELLEQPNPGDPSFAQFVAAFSDDMLTLDAGAIEKERTLRGEVAYLWPTDGGAILVDRMWSGNPRAARYFFQPPGGSIADQIPLLNSDLTYLKIHNRSYSGVGISYLETLRMAVEAELAVMAYNVRSVQQAAPDGIMDMGENARTNQVEAFQSFWDTNIAGRGMMAFWGGTKGAKFIDFHKSNKDMEMMAFYELVVRQFAAVMQLSPQDLGLTMDVNKSNGEVLQQNTDDRGFLPLLGTVQDYMTSEICWDPGFGGRNNNIGFRFKAVSDRQSQARALIDKENLAGMPSESINGARMARGQEPFGDPLDETNPFNQLMANTSQGLVTLEKIPTAYELAMRKNEPAAGADGSTPAPALRRVKSDGAGDMVVDPVIDGIATEIKAITGPTA